MSTVLKKALLFGLVASVESFATMSHGTNEIAIGKESTPGSGSTPKCDPSIQRNDDSVACDKFCKDRGSQSGQTGGWDGINTCRCDGYDACVIAPAACPVSISGTDSSVSCEAHCKDELGFLAGQTGIWDDTHTCRCRKVEDSCQSDAVMRSDLHNMCYYDVCTIAFKIDCDMPPPDLPNPTASSGKAGCATAVWTSGNPSKSYCENIDDDNNPNNRFGWYKECCTYTNNMCVIAPPAACPESVSGTDDSVSCEAHCKDELGFLAGQTGFWGDTHTCRCRKEEDLCPFNAVMRDDEYNLCYYDVCTIA